MTYPAYLCDMKTITTAEKGEIILIKQLLFMLFFLLGLLSFSHSQTNTPEILLPSDLPQKAYRHIEKLVDIGPRPAGSRHEKKAAKYVRRQFRKMGMKTNLESFRFEAYEFIDLDLQIESTNYTPMGLGYVPYRNQTHFEGKAIIFDLDDTSKYGPSNLAGRVLITCRYNQHFQYLQYQPALIIYMDPNDFSKLELNTEVEFELSIDGEYTTLTSQNVVGQIGDSTPGKPEILIGAHIDSYRNSPGASDDGSGVGILIELARYFSNNRLEGDVVLKFIAFGAEEVGILGARHYVHMHSATLSDIKLYFNIDDVGGDGVGAIESTGGVSMNPTTPNDDLSFALAMGPWEGINSYWRCLPEAYLMGFITSVNHPPWLGEVILSSINSLNYEINNVQNLGADGMAFTNSGVVTSGIVIQGQGTHTPEDDLDKINLESLMKAADITANIIVRTHKTEVQ